MCNLDLWWNFWVKAFRIDCSTKYWGIQIYYFSFPFQALQIITASQLWDHQFHLLTIILCPITTHQPTPSTGIHSQIGATRSMHRLLHQMIWQPLLNLFNYRTAGCLIAMCRLRPGRLQRKGDIYRIALKLSWHCVFVWNWIEQEPNGLKQSFRIDKGHQTLLFDKEGFLFLWEEDTVSQMTQNSV